MSKSFQMEAIETKDLMAVEGGRGRSHGPRTQINVTNDADQIIVGVQGVNNGTVNQTFNF
jgi:hypothetical protein